MTKSAAFLECRCGACRIRLCDPTVRYRTQCLCCDCRQRGLISASKRPGNELPPAVATYQRGIDLLYFTNALHVDDASFDLIEFSKLREGAFNTTAMSICCGTLLCGIHPGYEGTTISVNADSCRVTVPSSMENQAYLFGRDFPPDKYAVLQRQDNIPKVYSLEEEGDSAPMRALLTAVTAPIPRGIRGRCQFIQVIETPPSI